MAYAKGKKIRCQEWHCISFWWCTRIGLHIFYAFFLPRISNLKHRLFKLMRVHIGERVFSVRFVLYVICDRWREESFQCKQRKQMKEFFRPSLVFWCPKQRKNSTFVESQTSANCNQQILQSHSGLGAKSSITSFLLYVVVAVSHSLSLLLCCIW